MTDDSNNSGKYNTGYCNSGNYNSGYSNSGYSNSGNYNSGNYNSGYSNSGNSNSGNYNSGNYNVGHFNTTNPTVRLFNKDTGKPAQEIDIPHIVLPLTEWDDKTKTLKELSYKEAWAKAWSKLSENTKKQFQDLPNFDASIFKEITGIDLGKTVEISTSCAGITVEINGIMYTPVRKDK